MISSLLRIPVIWNCQLHETIWLFLLTPIQYHASQEHCDGAWGLGPQLFPHCWIFGIVDVSLEIFGLLLLVKTKVLNFIRKSLNLAPLLYRFHDAFDVSRGPVSTCSLEVAFLTNDKAACFQDIERCYFWAE